MPGVHTTQLGVHGCSNDTDFTSRKQKQGQGKGKDGTAQNIGTVNAVLCQPFLVRRKGDVTHRGAACPALVAVSAPLFEHITMQLRHRRCGHAAPDVETWHCSKQHQAPCETLGNTPFHCQGCTGIRSNWMAHGMPRHGMVWYGMVWYGMVWYGMVWCSVVWNSMVWCSIVWYGVVWCGMVWYGMVW